MCAPCEKRHTLSKIPDSVWNFNSRLLCRERQCDHNNLTDAVCYFDPRPPRGGRLRRFGAPGEAGVFQSTPPSRGATGRRGPVVVRGRYFNPRPPRGGRHSPRSLSYPSNIFQSTPPSRGATVFHRFLQVALRISIHAPLAGGDILPPRPPPSVSHFNPRPPRGGRLQRVGIKLGGATYFNPRPPRGGRHPPDDGHDGGCHISIHAPLAGGDFFFYR